MLEGWVFLRDIGLEVNFGALHLKEGQQCLVPDRSRVLYILDGSPEAELEFVIIGYVSVRGSADGLHCARRVLDRQVLCEFPATSGILTSLLSSKASVDMYRCIGPVVLVVI